MAAYEMLLILLLKKQEAFCMKALQKTSGKTKIEKPAFTAGFYFVYSESLGLVVSFILSRTVLVLIALQDYSTKRHHTGCLAEGEETIVETHKNRLANNSITLFFLQLVPGSHLT